MRASACNQHWMCTVGAARGLPITSPLFEKPSFGDSTVCSGGAQARTVVKFTQNNNGGAKQSPILPCYGYSELMHNASPASQRSLGFLPLTAVSLALLLLITSGNAHTKKNKFVGFLKNPCFVVHRSWSFSTFLFQTLWLSYFCLRIPSCFYSFSIKRIWDFFFLTFMFSVPCWHFCLNCSYEERRSLSNCLLKESPMKYSLLQIPAAPESNIWSSFPERHWAPCRSGHKWGSSTVPIQ